MNTTTPSVVARTPGRFAALAAVACGAFVSLAGLTGCQVGYSVDVRNQTPQPVYAQLLERTGSGSERQVAATRLGPGDRAGLGPVRAKPGAMTLVIDTPPNPGRPAFMELPPGLTVIEVTQDGDDTAGPIRLREVQ